MDALDALYRRARTEAASRGVRHHCGGSKLPAVPWARRDSDNPRDDAMPKVQAERSVSMNMPEQSIADERRGLPSASGMDRVYNCPGSRALEKDAPKEAPTDEALEGTEIAEALETANDEGLDEQGRAIAKRLADMEAKAIDDWCAEKQLPPSATVLHREERFWIYDRRTLNPISSAKPDVVATNHKAALTINHKTGYIEVPHARTNIQSRIEALSVWHSFDGEITDVRAAIAQFRFRGKFSATDYDLNFLNMAERELELGLWRSENSDAPRVPGFWCKYCRAKGFCPEARALTMLPAVRMPSLEVAKKDIAAQVAQWDLPTLAFLRHKKSFIENILEAVSTRLRTFSPDELATVGLQLVGSEGVRSLPDIQALWGELYKVGVTEDEFRSICKAPYGAAQTLLMDKLNKDKKLTDTEAKKLADEVLAPAVKMAPRAAQLKSL
jgi:hypothetical protein